MSGYQIIVCTDYELYPDEIICLPAGASQGGTAEPLPHPPAYLTSAFAESVYSVLHIRVISLCLQPPAPNEEAWLGP